MFVNQPTTLLIKANFMSLLVVLVVGSSFSAYGQSTSGSMIDASPEQLTLAQPEGDKSESIQAQNTPPSVVTVRVTKEELSNFRNQKFPNSDSLPSQIRQKIGGLLTTMSANQSGTNTKLRDFASSQQEYSKKEAMFIKSVPGLWTKVGSKSVDRSKLSSILSSNMKTALEIKTKEALPIIAEFQSGFKFSLYSAKSPATQHSSPNIRYGLFVQEIIHTPSKGIAAYGNSIEQNFDYASKAKVVYRVEKLESNDGSNLMFSTLTEESQTTTQSYLSQDWLLQKLPSTNFDVIFEAGQIDHANSSSSNMPAAKATFKQVDGLYSMQCLSTKGMKFDKQVHTFTIPIAENMKYQREHDKSFKLTKSTFIFNPVKIPQGQLVANYDHIEKKSLGEFAIRQNSRTFIFNYATRAGWKPGQPLGLEKDVVSFGFENKF